MRRTLAVLALAALGTFGPLAAGGTAYACGGTVNVCQEAQECNESINICTGAQQCSGTVDVCPMAHPDDCAGNVDVCLDFIGP